MPHACPLLGAFPGLLLAWGLTRWPPAEAAAGALGLTALLYAAASVRAGRGRAEPFWRGALLGLSAGLNFALLPAWAAWPLAGINLLAATPLTRRARFRQLLGWAGWGLPLGWPATALGLLALALNALWPPTVRRVWVDWATGTVVLVGGWLWWPGFCGGYSLGQFAFLTPDAPELLAHETGHTLNNAAFGSLFHFIGAVDELLIQRPLFQRQWADAYAERLAESHRCGRGQTARLWG